ncbi:hypothetical protein [Adlercreutzia murintestinalis]|uniref:hypothetical protein n=1 Tax=Adlercreutzia murintestinalis TaxID=2941325 RepID=UPI00203EACA1|nr:hypothetical protein [Adlercreutzia murintestinalis]
MKKASKLMGAVGLSAALAVGCAMPAFAAAPTFGDDLVGRDSNGDTEMATSVTQNKGTTASNVWVDTYVDNLSVTVPLNVKVVTKASGGALKATPSTGVKNYNTTDGLITTGYRIENYSGLNVKVINVESDDTIAENMDGADKKWNLVASSTGVDTAGYSIVGKKGDLALTLAPSAAATSGITWGPGGASANDLATLVDYNEGNVYAGTSTPAVVDLFGATAKPYWEIAARQIDGTDPIPGILGLQIDGKSSPINPNFKSGLTDDDGNVIVEKAFQITYTIAAA